MDKPTQQPIDLFVLARDQLPAGAASDSRDPQFCRIVVQLCCDFSHGSFGASEMEAAIFSVLKQATWPRRGLFKLFGSEWLDFGMAHSNIGPFVNRELVLLLARSIAQSALKYRFQLFGPHGSSVHHQHQFKRAILYLCEAIGRGVSASQFASLPRLDSKS